VNVRFRGELEDQSDQPRLVMATVAGTSVDDLDQTFHINDSSKRAHRSFPLIIGSPDPQRLLQIVRDTA
jgi:hypothetical protein